MKWGNRNVYGRCAGVNIHKYSNRLLPVISGKSLYATPAIIIAKQLLAGFSLWIT